MEPDTPSTESDVSIESRMAAALAPESAEKPEAAPVDTADAEPSEDAAPVQEEADDGFDFEADDGTTVKLPKALESAVLRQRDYTQKTMQLATLQKQAEDRLQYAQAREQLSAAVLDDITELKSLENELKQYQQADWNALYDANPGQALKFQQQMRDLETKVTGKRNEIQGKAAHFQNAAKQHSDFQWQKAEEGARQILGTVTAQENSAMLQTINNLGITPDEFKSRFADPRIIALTHKAAKWDALQAGKSQSVAAAQKAPPVVKPGVSKGPGVAAEQKYRDTRASLKKTGSLNDAARLFVMRGLK